MTCLSLMKTNTKVVVYLQIPGTVWLSRCPQMETLRRRHHRRRDITLCTTVRHRSSIRGICFVFRCWPAQRRITAVHTYHREAEPERRGIAAEYANCAWYGAKIHTYTAAVRIFSDTGWNLTRPFGFVCRNCKIVRELHQSNGTHRRSAICIRSIPGRPLNRRTGALAQVTGAAGEVRGRHRALPQFLSEIFGCVAISSARAAGGINAADGE